MLQSKFQKGSRWFSSSIPGSSARFVDWKAQVVPDEHAQWQPIQVNARPWHTAQVLLSRLSLPLE
jgi:hypothetical protein